MPIQVRAKHCELVEDPSQSLAIPRDLDGMNRCCDPDRAIHERLDTGRMSRRIAALAASADMDLLQMKDWVARLSLNPALI